MAQDRTASQHESVRHAHRHGHPEPVPHLRTPGASEPVDDHGSEVEHFHVHLRGGQRGAYDHHPVADDDGNDSATTTADPLKSAGAAADNFGP